MLHARPWWVVVTVLAVALGAPCCSSDDAVGDEEGVVRASFLPATGQPAPGDVSMAEGDALEDRVTVDIDITDMVDVFAADFQIEWNPQHARYLGWSEGALLSKDGAGTSFTVTEVASGALRVEATRIGTLQEVDAVGTELLLSVEYRLRWEGSTAIAFRTPDASHPRRITDANGIVVSGGSWLSGQFFGR